MRTTKWIEVSDREPYKATKMSGGEGQQLKGFDARNRVIAQPNGVNRTPDIISRPGKHVPMDKGWNRTPDNYETPNDSFMGDPVEPKHWTKKNYNMSLPTAPTSIELSQHDVPKTKAGKQAKMHTVMSEFSTGALHSGSKRGPKVKSRAQAIAIGLSQSGQSNQ